MGSNIIVTYYAKYKGANDMGIAKNEHLGLINRKRFKCPVCNNYTLWIKKDQIVECENGCNPNRNQIKTTTSKKNYSGYYTTQELKEQFGYDNSLWPDITWNKESRCLYRKKQLEKMNRLMHRDRNINDTLHDLSITYYRAHPEKAITERELNHYDFMFNLTEDIAVSLNRMTKDFFLMNASYQTAEFALEELRLFPLSYYYFNLSQHLYETIERIIVWLALLYAVPFHQSRKDNTFVYLNKELKKNENYKKSGLRPLVETVMGNDAKNKLIEWRGTSVHDESMHLREMRRMNSKVSVEAWNEMPREEIEKQILQETFDGIIKLIEEIYTLYENMLEHLNGLHDISLNENAARMIFETGDLMTLNVSKERYVMDIIIPQYNKIKRWITSIDTASLPKEQKYILKDIVFRMEEIMKTCNYALNVDSKLYRDVWKRLGMEQVLDVMDRQYLVYSAASLVVSCYDKIARHLSVRYNLKKEGQIVYFDNFLNNNIEKNKVLTLAESIINNPDNSFCFLSEYRNEYTHILRKGAIYTNSMDIFEDYLIVAIAYNIQHIGSLLDCIFHD